MTERVDLVVSTKWALTQDPQLGDLENISIIIKSKKIKDLIPTEDLDKKYHYEDQIRADIIIPGFVNAHTHAAMVAFRGLADDLPLMVWLKEHIWPREKKYVNREFVELSLPLALAEMIKTGTTTYADMYFFQETAAPIVKKAGLRAVLGEGLISGSTPSFANPIDALSFTREFTQEFKSDPQIIPAVAPHAPYSCDRELLIKSMKIALEHDIPYLIHVSETEEEVKDIVNRFGKRPVQYLNAIGVLNEKVAAAHCVWLNEEEIDLMHEKNAGVVHNPESNLKLASGIAPVSNYLKKGINVGLGTDGAASNNDLDMLGELRTSALIQKVLMRDPVSMNAHDALHMATLGSARVLGLEKVTGSITPGKSADLVLFTPHEPHSHPLYNPYSFLAYAASSCDISHVISQGRLLYAYGRFLTLDYEKAARDIEKLASRLR